MTDKMAPSVIACRDIAGNPNRAVIAMGTITNHTTDSSQDMTSYLARIRVRLNKFATDKVAFVENPGTMANLQSAEGVSADPAARQLPNYVLKGEFYEKPSQKTAFYLCTFQLTNLATGVIVWDDSYEVRSLR